VALPNNNITFLLHIYWYTFFDYYLFTKGRLESASVSRHFPFCSFPLPTHVRRPAPTSRIRLTKKYQHQRIELNNIDHRSSIIDHRSTYCTDMTMDEKQTCLESAGNAVDRSISSFFYRLGNFCCGRPKTTIALAIGISIACAGGMAKLTPENRPEKLWVPQGTIAGVEQEVRFVEWQFQFT
jgi:hypothetical protein